MGKQEARRQPARAGSQTAEVGSARVLGEFEMYLVGVQEPVRVVSEGMASGKIYAGPPWERGK